MSGRNGNKAIPNGSVMIEKSLVVRRMQGPPIVYSRIQSNLGQHAYITRISRCQPAPEVYKVPGDYCPRFIPSRLPQGGYALQARLCFVTNLWSDDPEWQPGAALCERRKIGRASCRERVEGAGADYGGDGK